MAAYGEIPMAAVTWHSTSSTEGWFGNNRQPSGWALRHACLSTGRR
jgi:hypothetical protein